MSWLKEVFDFSNENKDPFIKFLFRLLLLVVVILVIFLTYDLITGKKLTLGSKDFIVVDPNETRKNDTSNIKSVKPYLGQKTPEKSDSSVSSKDSISKISKFPFNDVDKKNILDTIASHINSIVGFTIQIAYENNNTESRLYGYALKDLFQSTGTKVSSIESTSLNNSPNTVFVMITHSDHTILLVVGAIDSAKRDYVYWRGPN